MERPSIARCEDALDRSITFTLETVSKRCRLCEKLGHYAGHGSVEVRICFKIIEMHSTYQPNLPTDLTRCYIGVGRYAMEQDHRHLQYGEWNQGINVGPVARSLLRDVSNISPEPVALPIVSSSTGDRKALGMIRW